MSAAQSKTIRLGICMAGAVSAGAYTAGVADYLVETLERWEQKKKQIKSKKKNGETLTAQEQLIPLHEVVIEVLSGASAGGMTAAILGYSFNDDSYINKRNKTLIEENYDVPSDTDTPSKLYDCWVNMVDEENDSTFSKLMNTNDVVAVGKMKALLNSTPIDDIARKATAHKIDFKPPAYISDYLSVLLSVTNLEGVPVDIRFSNVESKNPTRNVLRMHSGFLHYQFREQLIDIDFPAEVITESSKRHLADAAKATGAFPFGLSNRKIIVKELYFNDFKKRLKDNYKIEVNLDLGGAANYVFNAIDGGTINNEPIGTTVRILESKKKSHHNGDENYVILIDPFPSVTNAKKETLYSEPAEYTLLQQLFKIIGAIRNQSMFKQEDLLKGLDMDQNRFLIYPAKRKFYFLACGEVEGFGGFLKKAFRAHDYQLGRKNCQAFLRYYFGEPVERFESVTGTTLSQEQIKKWSYDANYGNKDLPPLLKIPLIPDMLLLTDPPTEISTPEYDGITTSELKMVTDAIEKRLKKIIDSSYPSLQAAGKGIHWSVGMAMRWFPGFFKNKISGSVISKLNAYMEKTFTPQSIKQRMLVEKYAPLIFQHGNLFQKSKGVFARVASGGEEIISITTDGIETKNIASKGDFIVKNDTTSREEYILKPGKFNERYVYSNDDYYIPNEKARVQALQVTELNIYSYRMDELEGLAINAERPLYIEAPWNESQLLRLNDYLVCPLNKTEVYRIAKGAFDQTYNEVVQ